MFDFIGIDSSCWFKKNKILHPCYEVIKTQIVRPTPAKDVGNCKKSWFEIVRQRREGMVRLTIEQTVIECVHHHPILFQLQHH